MKAQIPYGYRIERGAAIPDPVEAPRLQHFFDLYVNRGYSVADARVMAEIDRCDQTCRNMLKNRIYLGTEYYPQLITSELMEKAEREIEARRGERHGHAQKYTPIPVLSSFTFVKPTHISAQTLYAGISPITL